MAEVILYKICLKRVFSLIKERTWSSCSINPFLNLPSRIIDDLMASSGYDMPKLSEVFLLLTSGSLTRLHLSSYQFWAEIDLFLNLIETNCFRSLRFLTWYSRNDKHIPLLETLIRSCPKLEEFHSNELVDFKAFLNCKEMKVLFFSVHSLFCKPVTSSLNLSVLASLRNLQVFFVPEMDSSITETILKLCPQLISIGHNDSLNSLQIIHENSIRKCEINNPEISNLFQLKRCVWGKNTEKQMKTDTNPYRSKFPEKIKTAVSLCPFVEELIIYIHHTDAIESLKNLKLLTHLKINFGKCDGDYMTHFLALLKVIGPKLKYLSMDSKTPIHVDIICNHCPRLQSLELSRLTTMSSPNSSHCNVFIKSLRVFKIDKNALLFLLSSCKNLEELLLCDAMCLDDNLLNEILQLNPLPKLKICEIIENDLTERGFRLLFKTATSLERVNFAPFQQGMEEIFENLIAEMNLPKIIYGEMFDIPSGGFGHVPAFFGY